MSREPMRVLVVDDEAPARKRLGDLLARDRDVERVFEAKDGVAAVTLIQEQCPDVVFLDVQMPGIDGFGVIDAVGISNMPLTVFVTGYDRFALQAFDAEAVDYLLKPFGDGRYALTMERIKRRLVELRSGNCADANAFGPEVLKLAARRATPANSGSGLQSGRKMRPGSSPRRTSTGSKLPESM